MAATQRLYKTKDVDMLVTSSTILESAIINKKFLQTKRSTWADPYFDDLKTKIENVTQTFLGVDSAKDLREATQSIEKIIKQATIDLAEFKVQVAVDFNKDKPRRDEILNQLGFKSYHDAAQKGDQEAFINLLYQFKKSMTNKLKDEIVAKGTAPETIDSIVGYADAMKNADVSQESFKGLKKTITSAAIKEFNAVYEEIIGISKISAKFFKDKADLKDQFSFSKVAKALNAKKKAEATTAPAASK